MSNRKMLMWGNAALIVTLGVINAPAAWAGSDDIRYDACPRCEAKNLMWSAGQFDQVYLWSGASRNAHPRNLNVDPLALLLNKISVKAGAKALPILGEDAAQELARGLVTAIARAEPQHDLRFFITSRANGGIFANRLAHSGTAFLDERGLNLIFGEANADFFQAWKGTRQARAFEFGSRTAASKVQLMADGLTQPRGDWVIIPLGAPASAPPPPQTVAGPATTQGVGDATVYQSVGNAAPAAAAPVAPAPVAAPPAKGSEQFFQAQEARLKAIKRLREQNLISEEEYQAKRREILKDL